MGKFVGLLILLAVVVYVPLSWIVVLVLVLWLLGKAGKSGSGDTSASRNPAPESDWQIEFEDAPGGRVVKVLAQKDPGAEQFVASFHDSRGEFVKGQSPVPMHPEGWYMTPARQQTDGTVRFFIPEGVLNTRPGQPLSVRVVQMNSDSEVIAYSRAQMPHWPDQRQYSVGGFWAPLAHLAGYVATGNVEGSEALAVRLGNGLEEFGLPAHHVRQIQHQLAKPTGMSIEELVETASQRYGFFEIEDGLNFLDVLLNVGCYDNGNNQQISRLREVALNVMSQADFSEMLSSYGIGETNSDVAEALKALGLEAGATPKEIKSAYRTLITQYHPDLFVGMAPEFQKVAEDKSREIIDAYSMLSKQAA